MGVWRILDGTHILWGETNWPLADSLRAITQVYFSKTKI